MHYWRQRTSGALFAVFLGLGPGTLVAGDNGEELEAVVANVTSSGFYVFWEADPGGLPDVRVFTGENGAGDDITSEARREAFPLAASAQPYSEPGERGEQRAFRAGLADRGLMLVRVSGLAPGEEYFVQPGSLDAEGEFQAEEGGSMLGPVETLSETGFVADFRQVIVDFQDETAEGSVAVLSVDGAKAPILAVVGDAAGGADRARFPLPRLVDAETGELLDPGESWNFEITHFPGGFTEETGVGSAPADPDQFHVARTTTLPFVMPPDVDVAWFEFEPIGEQMAGNPFTVTVTARTDAADLVTDFDGTALIDSDGDIEGGPALVSFEDGVAEDHVVTLESTGEYTLTAWDEESQAEGESNAFVVSTEWENWLSLHVDPEDLEDSMTEQRLADPDGRGQPMLMRYAFDIDDSAGGSVVEESFEEEGDERFLSVTFPRLQIAPDVRYVVVGSDDMGDWEVISVVEPGTPEWVTVQDNQPVNGSQRRFLRVDIVGDETFGFWRTGGFDVDALNDPAISGVDADPGDHGVTNFERYALGMSAIDPELERLPTRYTVTEGGEDFQELAFTRLTRGEDVRYVVEVTTDFPNWETISEFGPGEPAEVSIRDTEPLPEEGYRIMRLRIESDF